MADKSKQAQKRRVKNPETFRERALKASEDKEQPKRLAQVKRAGGKAARPVLRPAQRASSALFGLSFLKPFIVVLRLIGKIILPPYVRRSWQELRLVTWPNWKQSRQLTVAVLGFAIVFGAVIALVDYGLDKVFRQVLLK